MALHTFRCVLRHEMTAVARLSLHNSQGIAEKGTHDFFPLRIERRMRMRLTRLTIPISSVALVTLFAMQVSVNPGCLRRRNVLRNLVRPAPISPGVPPHCRQESRYIQGRLRFGNRSPELFVAHSRIVSSSFFHAVRSRQQVTSRSQGKTRSEMVAIAL